MHGQGQIMGQGAALGRSYPTMAAEGYVGQETAARQPEVVAEMERLQKAVDMLAMTTETLTTRLNPVRSQVGNTLAREGANGAPEPVLCGMADALRSQRRQLEGIQSSIQLALNELEI